MGSTRFLRGRMLCRLQGLRNSSSSPSKVWLAVYGSKAPTDLDPGLQVRSFGHLLARCWYFLRPLKKVKERYPKTARGYLTSGDPLVPELAISYYRIPGQPDCTKYNESVKP